MPSNNNLSQERISQKLSPTTERKSRTGIVVASVIGIVILIVIIAVIIVLVKPNTTETRNAVVTPDNVDEILAEMDEAQKTQAGQYEVMMNTAWEFENGSSASSNAYVENSTSNTNDVYFDVVRSDTGDTIYKSPTIPVGSHLEGITLDTPLDAGNYSCVITYHLLDDAGETLSTLNINLDIIINN